MNSVPQRCFVAQGSFVASEISAFAGGGSSSVRRVDLRALTLDALKTLCLVWCQLGDYDRSHRIAHPPLWPVPGHHWIACSLVATPVALAELQKRLLAF